MRKLVTTLIIFFINTLSLFSNEDLAKRHGLTFGFSGGRFGDNLLSYYQAKYLSYISKTPFIYKNFEYSEYLSLNLDSNNYEDVKYQFDKEISIKTESDLKNFFYVIRNPESERTLFTLEYFPADISEWDNRLGSNQILFNRIDNNKEFKRLLTTCIHPSFKIENFRKKNTLNVAIHVRTLSGSDTQETSCMTLPLKHVSTEYHIKQIKKVYDLNMKQPIHVFIFSDSKDPKTLKSFFEKNFSEENIVFSCRDKVESSGIDVLKDFFAMLQFDVLIATQSNFSMMVGRLGNFDMIIFPIHLSGTFPNYKVDRVQVISKGAPWFPYALNFAIEEK